MRVKKVENGVSRGLAKTGEIWTSKTSNVLPNRRAKLLLSQLNRNPVAVQQLAQLLDGSTTNQSKQSKEEGIDSHNQPQESPSPATPIGSKEFIEKFGGKTPSLKRIDAVKSIRALRDEWEDQG